MEKRFLCLVSKKLSGDISSAEEIELKEILNTDKEYRDIYDILFLGQVQYSDDDTMEAHQAYAVHFTKMQLDRKFEKNISKKETESEVKSFSLKMRQWGKVAAILIAVIVVVCVAKWLLDTKSGGYTNKNEIATKKGSKSKISLPDGTSVWLNGDSKISYAGNFDGSTREIHLSGEAFFDVVKDASRPFIIHTNAFDIRVLGTAFNVKAYDDDDMAETSVIRGLVQVTVNDKEKKSVLLRPMEKIKITTENNIITASKTNIINKQQEAYTFKMDSVHTLRNGTVSMETFWVENTLAFDNESLQSMATKIARWYNVDIEILNENLKQKHFTAVFEHKSLPEVLEALKISGDFNYSLKDEKVIIY